MDEISARDEKELMLKRKGLQRIDSLSLLFPSRTFFVDANYAGDGFPIYPVAEKAVHKHDLLNLYGTHWRYVADSKLCMIVKDTDTGDIGTVLHSISVGEKVNRFPCYAFTRKYLEQNRSLWTFVPGSEGWEFYHDVVLPQFRLDMLDYKKLKGESVRSTINRS
ncbi:MAG: hypothetical protein V1866_02560 [archaeon]